MALVTVAPSGGDYTSLSAAEAGEQQDLTALGDFLEIECAAMTDTTAVTFVGWTTSSSFFIRVKAAAGAEATLPFATGAGAYTLQTGSQDAIFIDEDWVECIGIQVENTRATASTARGFRINDSGAANKLVKDCIVKLSGAGAGSKDAFFVGGATGTTYFENCFGFGANVGNVFHAVRPITARNCTAANSAVGFFTEHTFIAVNCLATNCTTDFSGSFNAASDYNASEDTTAPGSNSRVSQTFTFVNAGGGDWRLASGDAGAKGFGTDLSGEATYPFSDDFEGDARGATWDIGADQFVAAGGSALLSILQAHGPFLGSAH